MPAEVAHPSEHPILSYLGLAYAQILRAISPKYVIFPDFDFEYPSVPVRTFPPSLKADLS